MNVQIRRSGGEIIYTRYCFTFSSTIRTRLFTQPITSTFARSKTLSAVKLYNSSISPGRKDPEPCVSGLAAASSDAMVTARTLVYANKNFWMVEMDVKTNPPIAALSMSPFTSVSSFRGSLLEAAAAQKTATHVPTIHPEPVISPRSLCPLSSFTTVKPSET
jgi:hypothetical protein